MKYLIYTVILVALVLIGINFSALNFSALLEGDSAKALIVILVGFCVILLMAVLLVSRSIAKKEE